MTEIQERLLSWGQKHYKPYPWRHPAEGWHALVAEILLQRTKVSSVVQVYENFLVRFPTLLSLAESSVEDIEKIIYPLGLLWRAPILKRLGEQLTATNGEIPPTADILKLPGVGAYVAAAWLGFHGGVRSVIIDANVVRWLCRLIGQPYDGETRRKKWLIDLAEVFTPLEDWKAYNYAVLDFTMEICVARPKCELCPLGQTLCAYGRKRLVDSEKPNALTGGTKRSH